MGARFCLHVALTNPELVAGLVLLGGTPGTEDPDERAARRAQDLRTAARTPAEGPAPLLDAWRSPPARARPPAVRALPEAPLPTPPAGLPRTHHPADTGA